MNPRSKPRKINEPLCPICKLNPATGEWEIICRSCLGKSKQKVRGGVTQETLLAVLGCCSIALDGIEKSLREARHWITVLKYPSIYGVSKSVSTKAKPLKKQLSAITPPRVEYVLPNPAPRTSGVSRKTQKDSSRKSTSKPQIISCPCSLCNRK